MIIIQDIAEKIGKFSAQYSENENTEVIITYLSKRFIINLIWLSFLFALSSYLKLRKEIIIFLLVLIPLRRCFGGFHVNSEWLCLVISIIMPLFLVKISTIIHLNIYYILFIYIFAYISILFKGVIDNPKKRLKTEQKNKFRQQGIVTLIIITIVHLFFIKNIIISNVIGIAVLLAFANLYLENK